MGSILANKEILNLFEPDLDLNEFYKRSIEFLEKNYHKKVGFAEFNTEQNSISLKYYSSTKIQKSAYSKIIVSCGDDSHPFNLCLKEDKILTVKEINFPEFKKFFSVYEKIADSQLHILFPVKYKSYELGIFAFDFNDESELDEFSRNHEFIFEFIKIFSFNMKKIQDFNSIQSKFEKYKNLHDSSLTLNKLYMDNVNEILKMTLLSVSGIVDANIYLLLIYNRKTDSINLHKLYIHGTELDFNQILLSDIEKEHSKFLLECKEPTIYSFRDIEFSPKIGFHGKQIIALPFFELQENRFSFLLGRNSRKIYSADEFDILNSFSEIVKITIDNSFLYHRMANQERLEKGVEDASDIQMNLLPREIPKIGRFDFAGIMIPAREIGGDYYDFLPSPDGSEIIFAIGDVSGKGVPAGMVMATARTIVHSITRRKISLIEIIRDLNSYLYFNYKNSVILRFMSLTLLNLITPENKISFAGGGHGSILIYRAEKEEVEVVATGGMVLGISADIPDSPGEIELGLNDTLLLFTDGATECTNSKGESYEEERLIHSLEKYHTLSAHDILKKIHDDINQFTNSTSIQHDDITLVALKRTG